MIIGAHVSIAGGLDRLLLKAKEIGADAIQIFITPPQTFKEKEYSKKDVNFFLNQYKKIGFNGLFFHAIYLLNLTSDKEYLVNLSKKSLIYYMKMGERFGAIGTIFHVGSCKSQKCIFPNKKLSQDIDEILEKTPKNQFLIIENSAGGGGRVGVDLDELANIFNSVKNKDRLRFCIDTQHLFATGIDVSNYKIFNKWLLDFDQKIGINNLICIHLNDSKTELGSKVDRHENIGEGKIGKKGFQQIFRQPLLQSKLFITEVPGFDNKGPDKDNLNIIKKLIE